MSVNDTVQLTVQGTVAGQTHIHTQHFRYLDPTSTEQGLIDAWQASARTAYRNMFNNTDLPVILLRASQVCGAIPLRAPVEEIEAGANQAGTLSYAGQRAPSWLAVVFSERTAFAGKSRRGRFYIGGLYEAAITGNDVESTAMTVYTAYRDALMNTFGPSGTNNLYRLVVYSRKLASVPGTQCQDSSTVITSMGVNVELGSMKSRKPGSGT